MALFDLSGSGGRKALADQLGSQPNALLLDVREGEEYARGHLPGARNVPLQALRDFIGEVPDRDTPLYVYCQSGARARRAVTVLRGVGYTGVQDLGGIDGYQGELER